ncbi:hypothetical protein BLNAU_14271 [Blattamonas nauphoetae]|uniref:Uncharacterized protein n=1 Tax=Blattamonas nauphoetae TaxID=2049346 RepID=A0ABQ9XHR2_9EUKA|nr:hypothetical protein BLNAU_14271 [Blattamonas nauphoetae]
MTTSVPSIRQGMRIGMVRCRHQLVLLALLVQRLIDLKTSTQTHSRSSLSLVAFWSTTLTAETAYTTHQSTSPVSHTMFAYLRCSRVEKGRRGDWGWQRAASQKKRQGAETPSFRRGESVRSKNPHPLRVDVGHVGKDKKLEEMSKAGIL